MGPLDPIETLIGRFGLYQSLLLFVITIVTLPMIFQLNNVVFIIPDVDYICLDDNANNATNFCPCKNPQYDQRTIASSVTSEWDLICERSYLASLAQSMLQVGMLIGSLVYGFISDRYGRKKSALLSMSLQIVFIIISALIPELWMFLVFRLLTGTSVGGTILSSFILFIEITGKSFIHYAIVLYETSSVLGYFTQAIIAYFVRDWRYLQLVTSAPWIISVYFYFVIPESPRWLITAGKTREAIDLLTRIAKKNKRPTDNIEAVVDRVYKDSIKNKKQHATYLDLFKTAKLRKCIIIMAVIWMCCSAVYFGVNQYIGRLKGSLYVNVMIAAISLVPGLFFVLIATLHFKRKISIITSFCVTAVSLLVFFFVPYTMYGAYVLFTIIGLSGAYSSFVQISLHASETFPTVVRNSALGICSMFARLGGFFAPFIVNIESDSFSVIIFIGLSLISAFLFSFLPETKDKVLMNTIEETIQDSQS